MAVITIWKGASLKNLCFALIGLAFGASVLAQTTTKTNEPAGGTVTTSQLTGEVVQTEGNWLLARMRPSGEYTFVYVPTGRTAIVDGHARTLNELKPGTVLTARYITTDQSVAVRTTRRPGSLKSRGMRSRL